MSPRFDVLVGFVDFLSLSFGHSLYILPLGAYHVGVVFPDHVAVGPLYLIISGGGANAQYGIVVIYTTIINFGLLL